ncbi:MAG: D-alanyl-D-alanine carboxypeptidase/D-alanyl-D-alanine-endopeptidase [Candidatus Sumerlaeaceae bacterium]|nr:D-alanyl-D-alanine carboxypeptidase/D-alanyl-D-alanine-endopeptidase [Candidatus Sumerlaeaceae bacterium]
MAGSGSRRWLAKLKVVGDMMVAPFLLRQIVFARNARPGARILAALLIAFGLWAAPWPAIAANSKPAATDGKSKPVVEKTATADKKPAADDDDSKDSDASKSTKTASKAAKPKPTKIAAKAPAQRADPITTNSPQTLPQAMANALRVVSGASRWGVKVILLETGASLFDTNGNGLFVPASNRKLFTGALALDQLGPEFQFRTYLYRTGNITPDGTLEGNLVIRPQGDPTFSNRLAKGAPEDWIYRDWVTKCQAANIKNVTGELIVDCQDWNLNDLAPKGWAARIQNDYYAPHTSPLTLNENLLEFKVRPGEKGKPGIIDFVPAAVGYPVINQTVTGTGPVGVFIKRSPEGAIVISGNPPTKNTDKIYSLPGDNPALFAAAVFRSHLLAAGITVKGALRISTQKNAVPAPTAENVVAVYISPPMREMVKTMMKDSNNHFAEQLYVAVSAVKTGRGGYSQSKAIEQQFLQRAGVNTRECNFEDGSGLSLQNKVSPTHVCQLLAYMRRHDAASAYFDSLPIAGRDGTLRRRMQNENVNQRVHAKTGYVNQVVCLSGYLTLQPSATLCFSFLVNDVRTGTDAIKGTQDRLCEILSLLQL